MRHEFRVYGKIRGQARPRVTRNGKHTYKVKEDVNWERKIREAFINSGGRSFGNAPIALAVISHRALPKSTPKKITQQSDVCKPDASNILKSVEDALNGIAYHDDRQIVCPIPLKMPRKREELEFLDIIITDEITEEMLEASIRGIL